MREEHSGYEAGFSLIELMVALMITLIVSGAIYGLMAQGQGAFRREPQLTDRQQNARIAIDLLESDLANAGRGMPVVSQVFTNGLEGAGDEAGNGTSDQLELIMGGPGCDSNVVCSPAGAAIGTGVAHVTRESTLLNACFDKARNPLALVADSRYFTLHSWSLPVASSICAAGAANGQLTLAAPLKGAFTVAATTGVTLYPAQLVRYQLTAPDAQGIQDLRRSAVGDSADPTDWQLVARGIEDLQVDFMHGAGDTVAWTGDGNPGLTPACAAAACTTAEYQSVVSGVRITLRSRTIASDLNGSVGDHAVHGTLTTVVVPRAATVALELAAHEGQMTYN